MLLSIFLGVVSKGLDTSTLLETTFSNPKLQQINSRKSKTTPNNPKHQKLQGTEKISSVAGLLLYYLDVFVVFGLLMFWNVSNLACSCRPPS